MNCEKSKHEVDWDELKKEYITTDTSYRKLSEKYGVSQSTLRKVAAKEQWVQLRNNFGTTRDAELVNQLGTQAGAINAKLDEKYFQLVEQLLLKAEQVMDAMPTWQVSTIKEMATAMKYIKECKGIKSDIDVREQEARIKNLERQIPEEQEKSGGIVLLPPVMPKNEWETS